jgi:hypothetical protein
LIEARALVLAGLLAALAGMVDVIGYLHLSGLFVSYNVRGFTDGRGCPLSPSHGGTAVSYPAEGLREIS